MIRPLFDRVLVKRKERETKTPGGIVLPDTAQKRSLYGEVLAVGPGAPNRDGRLVPPSVRVGQVVLFSEYAGKEVREGTETYLMLAGDDLLGVVE